MKEPEVAEILQHIWAVNKRGSRRQRLADIKALPAYRCLLKKLSGCKYLLDSEIALMLGQVQRVNEIPYHLDRDTDRIGYKVMDTISYEATYGYQTVFAYLKEADEGNLKDKEATLANILTMPISCGQFSYANISPARILGVSGTLDAMGKYEKDVLAQYGIDTFMYVPSVYGKSNFTFDKAGEGIRIESTKSDYFYSITDQIQKVTKEKRAAIVFFQDNARLREFTSSSFYRKLSRQKKLLTEEMSPADKEFVINKAATAGQITISTAVFGRGTDFFCKDDRVQKNGGVHVIHAFLSTELSEEIQLQGRTARQGKKGSYQMILLESDLEEHFGLPPGSKDSVARQDVYQWLCDAREKCHDRHCQMMNDNLTDATKKDQNTHRYFDALLSADQQNAYKLFKEMYTNFKKQSMPSTMDLDLAFAIDITGSMAPYARAAASTIKCLLEGNNSIMAKLGVKFPEIQFKLRVAVLGFKDIDDQSCQFQESSWRGGSHFTEQIQNAVRFVDKISAKSSGGGDLAEDHLGALDRCMSWNAPDDWTAQIKFIMLLTDAPTHGMAPQSSGFVNTDNYPKLHPQGLSTEQVIDNLLQNDIDLFFCSFNPPATSETEKELSRVYIDHSNNTAQHEVTCIPMVPSQHHQDHNGGLGGSYGNHIIFVLDESGSMRNNWSGVIVAYRQYLQRRHLNQSESDLVSVVQFGDSSRITVSNISGA